MSEPVKIVITMEGGLIQNIEKGEFVEVVVMDYDTEGLEPEELDEDAEGNAYYRTEW